MAVEMGNYRFRTFKARVGLYNQGVNYDEQGAIYFACKHYFTLLTKDEQERYRQLLWESGKRKQKNFDALFEYTTCELSVQDICKLHGVGESNFYRYLDDFYKNFEYVKKVY